MSTLKCVGNVQCVNFRGQLRRAHSLVSLSKISSKYQIPNVLLHEFNPDNLLDSIGL